jgi:hypothetical protein
LLDHVKRFASGSAYFLAELDVFQLLKLRHSRFPPLADNYPSEQWLSLWIHRTYATASCWDKSRKDKAPSRGSTYPL